MEQENRTASSPRRLCQRPLSTQKVGIGNTTGSCRNDKVDSKRTILPTTLQNIPRLDENIDCFGEVFSLQLPDRSRLVDPDLFLLKRFFQRNVAASIDLVVCVEKKNCKIFVSVRSGGCE